MSNLYKQRYVVSGSGSARVINSNSKVAQKMQELEDSMRAQMQIPNPQGSVDGFVAGIQAGVVEVLPEEPELSPEEIREQAQNEADTLLAEAKNQAESILAAAQNEAESIRQQAKQEGFKAGQQDGNAKAAMELAKMRKQMEQGQQQMEEDYQQKIQELEPYLVGVISQVFEKVFHVQFDDKKEILVYLIQKVILSAEGTKEFLVRVSLKDYEFVEGHKREIMERVGAAVHVEVIADVALQERQCMIETDSGVFDCGIDVQLDNLIKALQSLSL